VIRADRKLVVVLLVIGDGSNDLQPGPRNPILDLRHLHCVGFVRAIGRQTQECPRRLLSSAKSERLVSPYLTVPTVPFTLKPDEVVKVRVFRMVGFVALAT
jgi:hypothetical protein